MRAENNYISNVRNANSSAYRAKLNSRIVIPLIKNQYINIKFPSVNKLEKALIDTGASNSFLSNKLVETNPYLSVLHKYPIPSRDRYATLADNSRIFYEYTIQARLLIESKSVVYNFIVCKNLSEGIILGQDFLTQEKAVISYLNDAIYLNHEPRLLATTNIKLKAHHTSIMAITIPSYLQRNELLCLQPSIAGIKVNDNVVQITNNGRYQQARIMVCNDSDYNRYINRNDCVGVFDFVKPSYLYRDPVQKVLGLTNKVTGNTSASNKINTLRHQGSENKNTENKPNIRPLTLFQDRTIDISRFEELTQDYNFEPLTVKAGLDKPTLDGLKYVILKNLQAFHKPGDKIKKINDFEVNLELKKGATPWKARFYPIHPTRRQQVDKEVDRLVYQGVIEPIEQCPKAIANSSFVSPCMVIKKPHSLTELRLVTDLRLLNERLKDYPPQETLSVQQSLIEIASMSLDNVSNLDVSQAYFQLGLTKESYKFSVISIGLKKYVLKRLQMGLSQSANFWSHYMIKFLGDLYFNSAISYLDDIYLASKTPIQHLNLLNEIFARSIKVNLQFKASKCLFFQDQIQYLGQTISKDKSVRPKPLKVKAMLNLKEPNTLRALRRFLGMINFFKNYIPNLANIASPLYKLLKGGKKYGKIVLMDEHRRAINKLKNIMAGDRVVYLPDYSQEFHLVTDASSVGISGVLFQRIKVGDEMKLRVIAYGSRTLNATQQKYDIYILEFLALISCLLTFQNIVGMSKIHVYTDNIALKFLIQCPKNYSRLNQNRIQKWLLIVESFQCAIHYLKGVNNSIADCLSRDLQKQGNSLESETRIENYIQGKLGAIFKRTNMEQRLADLKTSGYHM